MALMYGDDRNQEMMFPPCLDDWIGANNPVRAIDLFVEQVKLKELKVQWSTESGEGRPAYDPRALLKLYLYGSANRIRSSRDLEKATHKNVEVMWLMRRLQPDHWTINEFRKKNAKAIKNLFRQFHTVCRELGLLVDSEVAALDSAFFKGVNNSRKAFTQDQLKKWLGKLDEKIDAYLALLDSVDVDHEPATSAAEAEGVSSLKLEELKQKRQEVQQMLKEAEASPTGQLCQSDPEARKLKKPGDKTVGYQAQIVVEAQNHLIVAQETMKTGNDADALVPMALAAQQALSTQELKLLCDSGYYRLLEAAQCQEQGVELHLPVPADAQKEDGPYGLGAFVHDSETDSLICPQGQALKRHKNDTFSKNNRQKVYSNTKACANCPVRSQCTQGAYRKIKLSYHLETKRQLKARQQADNQAGASSPTGPRRRAAVVEHVFGSLKFWMGGRFLLTRGHESVSAEISLSCLAYNFKRVIKLVGVEKLLEHFNTQQNVLQRA